MRTVIRASSAPNSAIAQIQKQAQKAALRATSDTRRVSVWLKERQGSLAEVALKLDEFGKKEVEDAKKLLAGEPQSFLAQTATSVVPEAREDSPA